MTQKALSPEKKQKTRWEKSGFSEALISWYRLNGRDLPWRNTQDAEAVSPYAIWVSEVMLQQTQVKTVIDYYHRFLAKFPSIKDLAKAPLDDVLKLWEGLGYYTRARNLHKAAEQIVRNHQGNFPTNFEDVLALPGIGQSTAGAILTFGYGQKHPLLDGNVKRVLSRLYNEDRPVSDKAVIEQMWQQSEALLAPALDPYDFNQGIMELGATICLPKEPRCLICPIQTHCDAYSIGVQHERPVTIKKQPTPHYTIAVGVIRNNQGQVFIQQRPNEGLLGGLWEFPGGKQEAGEVLEDTVRREIKEELGLSVSIGAKITTIKHAYTHFKITLHAYECLWQAKSKTEVPTPTAAQGWQWVEVKDLSQFAFPKANKKVLDILLQTDYRPA